MKIYQYPSKEAEQRVKDTIERGLGFSKKDLENVEIYLEDVKNRGDQAPFQTGRACRIGSVGPLHSSGR